jgi:hypothetical protein
MKTIFIFSLAASVSIYSGMAQKNIDFAMLVCGNYLGCVRISNSGDSYKKAYMATLTIERIGSNKIRVSSKDATTFELELKKQADKKIGGGDNNQCVCFEDYYTHLTRTAAHASYTDATHGVRWAFNGSRLGSLIFPPLITPQWIYSQRTLCKDDKNEGILGRRGQNKMNFLICQQHIKNYAYKFKSPFNNGINELVNKINNSKTRAGIWAIDTKKIADLSFERSRLTKYCTNVQVCYVSLL